MCISAWRHGEQHKEIIGGGSVESEPLMERATFRVPGGFYTFLRGVLIIIIIIIIIIISTLL